jgi:NitT/TauT family transport system substrate-binding protein
MIHQHVYADMPLDKADPRIRAGDMRINAGGRLNLASVRDQLDWFKSENMVPGSVTMEKLVDSSFVSAS